MAGNFVIWNISGDALREMLAVCKEDGDKTPAKLTSLAHAEVGWTDRSRDVLAEAISDRPLPDRSNLPPHIYLEVGSGFGKACGKYFVAANSDPANWIHGLLRPASFVRNMKALPGDVAAFWDKGDKVRAYARWVQLNPVSVEIYKIDGEEADHYHSYSFG